MKTTKVVFSGALCDTRHYLLLRKSSVQLNIGGLVMVKNIISLFSKLSKEETQSPAVLSSVFKSRRFWPHANITHKSRLIKRLFWLYLSLL